MTNKKAIKFLDQVRKILLNDKSWLESTEQPINEAFDMAISALQAQHEIVRCKDCEYGNQDEVGRWFCRGLGCQIGNEDGSGYCADAERRTNGVDR